MTSGRRRHIRLPMGLAVGSAMLTLAGATLSVRNDQPLIGGSYGIDLIIVGTVYAGVGGILASRLPGNRIGWLLLAAAWLWAADLFATQYAVFGAITAPGTVPAVGWATWAAAWLWVPGNSLLLFGLPLLFPDGRLPSPRWRPVAAVGVFVVGCSVAGQALAVWPIRNDVTSLAAGYDATSGDSIAAMLASIGAFGQIVVLPILAMSALVQRYRMSGLVQRQQLRWFMVTAGACVALVVADQAVGQLVPAMVGVIDAVGLTLIPIGIAIAVLRYRLYEIDRIISRTIGWAIVSGFLVLVFAGLVVGLQAALTGFTQGQTLAVAASTLVAFALFQPVRRRVQRAVDRRFDRARYDAERTATAFGDRLRDETDVEVVASDLTGTAQAALAPRALGIWLRGTSR